jgi:hypothetical protein
MRVNSQGCSPVDNQSLIPTLRNATRCANPNSRWEKTQRPVGL